MYADEQVPEEDLSFTEVLDQMRSNLKRGGYSQIPQLSSMNPIDVSHKFDLVPDAATGKKRAVMIGINYVGDSPGELSGCWNDVLNMKKYIMDVHGFEEDNIVVLMDDGQHTEPTAGKSALVLFHHMNSCVQYEVTSYELNLSSCDCLCNPHVLTEVAILSLSSP